MDIGSFIQPDIATHIVLVWNNQVSWRLVLNTDSCWVSDIKSDLTPILYLISLKRDTWPILQGLFCTICKGKIFGHHNPISLSHTNLVHHLPDFQPGLIWEEHVNASASYEAYNLRKDTRCKQKISEYSIRYQRLRLHQDSDIWCGIQWLTLEIKINLGYSTAILGLNFWSLTWFPDKT